MAEPAITLRAAHDSGPLAMPITRIVVHATCPNVGYPAASAPGAAQGTAKYFQQAAAGGSAHYVEDPTTEAHCVPDNVEAWHAPPNPHSLGVEICAEGGNYPKSYTRAQWLSPQVWPGVLRAAGRVRELCDRFGVPKVKIGPAQLVAGARGICGHVDVSNAWHQTNHSDPGPAFPWPEFMAAVNGSTTNPGDDMFDEVRDRKVIDNTAYQLTFVKESTDQIPALIAAIKDLAAAVAKIQAGGTVSVQAVADQLTVVPKQ